MFGDSDKGTRAFKEQPCGCITETFALRYRRDLDHGRLHSYALERDASTRSRARLAYTAVHHSVLLFRDSADARATTTIGGPF